MRGKKPWFNKRKSAYLTILSVILTGLFYFPILKGLFLGIKALWIPTLIGSTFFFFWSYPRQMIAIFLSILLWIIIGPGIVGLWFWGFMKIISFSSENWLLTIPLTIFWTFGPIAILKEVLNKFGLISIGKKIITRKISLNIFQRSKKD